MRTRHRARGAGSEREQQKKTDATRHTPSLQQCRLKQGRKGRNNTKKKVTVQKAAETGKQGALSGAIFVCCSDSPQIKEDRSVRVKRRRDVGGGGHKTG